MANAMKPATHDDVEKVAEARRHLIAARELLKEAGAKKSAQKVRLALHSISGAYRHVQHRQLRTELGEL